MSDSPARSRAKGIRLTVAAIVVFMLFAVATFVHRVQLPRVLTSSELKINGAYFFDTPRDIGGFSLTDHNGVIFNPARLEGSWTLVFFGFTACPDICPTTMSFLDDFIGQLVGTEANDTAVVMITVDPARDTVEQLAAYVPHFNPGFLGVTGDFLEIHRVATALNIPFRKVPGQGENYQVDHSSNIVLINPRGHYHGFFKAPQDLAKMKITYQSARALWEKR